MRIVSWDCGPNTSDELSGNLGRSRWPWLVWKDPSCFLEFDALPSIGFTEQHMEEARLPEQMFRSLEEKRELERRVQGHPPTPGSQVRRTLSISWRKTGPPGHNFITGGASGPRELSTLPAGNRPERRHMGTARERAGFAWHPEQYTCPSLWYTVHVPCLFYCLAVSSLQTGLVFFFPLHEIFSKFSAWWKVLAH